jgi:hypothetical protein
LACVATAGNCKGQVIAQKGVIRFLTINIKHMKKQIPILVMIVLFLTATQQPLKAQSEYDVGVFYMPFWGYTVGGDPMTDIESHWPMISGYNPYIIGKGKSQLALMPKNQYMPNTIWYNDKVPAVLEQQLDLMSAGGIDFVIYDTYFHWLFGSFQKFWNSAIDNYADPNFNTCGLKFAMMWANDFITLVAKDPQGNGGSCNDFFNSGGGLDQMMTYWSTYINNPNYKKIDNKPVIYIYYAGVLGDPNYMAPGNVAAASSIEGITCMCRDHPFFSSMGNDIYETGINSKKTKFLLDKLKEKLGTDIYFVAVIVPPNRAHVEDPVQVDIDYRYNWLIKHPDEAGFNALTSYGYSFFNGDDVWGVPGVTTMTTCKNGGTYSPHNWSYNYTKMKSVHGNFYDYIINNSPLEFQIPVTPGFSRASLNKYEIDNNPGVNFDNYADACNDYVGWPKDNANGTPFQFGGLIHTAKNWADAWPQRTRKTIVISAWNEYAEGNVIEPTTAWGYDYLNTVRQYLDPTLPVITDQTAFRHTATPTPESVGGSASPGTGFDFAVLPNPVKNTLAIRMNNGIANTSRKGFLSFYLYDMKTHSLVKNWTNIDGQAQYSFDISTVQGGQYVLEVVRGKDKRARQVIIRD